MSTNIDYWEKVLANPIVSYKKLIEVERVYLQKNVTPHSKVLEIGCGNGRNIESLISITKNIVGIDNDPQAVKDAKKRLAKFLTVTILEADALALPFEDQSFDFVILLDTLVNFKENKLKSLLEMKRVLSKTGKVIISVYSEDAFDNRMTMYKQIEVPIERVDGTKIIFDKSVGANESEQFSKDQIFELSKQAKLKLVDCIKVEKIAYICKFIR